MSIIDRIRNFFIGKRHRTYNNMSEGAAFYTYDNTMHTHTYYQNQIDTTNNNPDNSHDSNDDSGFDNSGGGDSGADSGGDSGGDSSGDSGGSSD